MRRYLVIALLALGTVLGFGSGVAHFHHWRHHGGPAHSWCDRDHGHRGPGSLPPASP